MGRLGMGLGLARRRAGDRAGGSAPGTLATVFATAPTVHFHPHSAPVTLDASGRLTRCPDRRGLADLVAAAGYAAPRLMTDALGRAFLRFNGSEAAVIGNTLTVASNRGFMCLMVGRVHHASAPVHMVNPRFASYNGPTSNTPAVPAVGYLRATPSGNSAPHLHAGNPLTTSNVGQSYKVIPGCQLQVMATASRTTAQGGTRIYVNQDNCSVSQQSSSVSNYTGIVVGGSSGAINSESLTLSDDNVFDLYELALWGSGPHNAVADAIVAAAVSNWAIPQLDGQLVIEGDAISYGVPTTLPESPSRSQGLGSRLTEPGSSWLPGNLRVLNHAVPGSTVASLAARRDGANSVFDSGRYPGGPEKNRVTFQIGREDLMATGGTAAAHYANLLALIGSAATGYLQRGWSVVAVGNIAGPATPIAGGPTDGPITLQQRIEAVRAMLFSGTAINPAFAADTLSGPGQPFAGQVSVLPLHEITVGGDSRFRTAADASDTAAGCYDQGGSLPVLGGIDLMIAGGDDPACGYAALA